ncbi:hypothetical protein HNR23_000589 [Nocardiopsis mwathae]|uniref:Uncharacterized protein n=1 Tax=Nocardiopsis mwathae TaxID=1472723 RepID=A0A7W9YE82_9ACTN|nr:hypothetical protein [Nocardiopsis mwathae]MBB6170529.1 hypothetical protein [Nocardiopsis mwathae]
MSRRGGTDQEIGGHLDVLGVSETLSSPDEQPPSGHSVNGDDRNRATSVPNVEDRVIRLCERHERMAAAGAESAEKTDEVVLAIGVL